MIVSIGVIIAIAIGCIMIIIGFIFFIRRRFVPNNDSNDIKSNIDDQVDNIMHVRIEVPPM